VIALARFESARLEWLLRLATAAMLIGHGGFGAAMAKPAWLDLTRAVGLFEIALGLAVLIRPAFGLLVLVILWKVGTELLRPLAGESLWEFVERWSNYTAPFALLYMRGWPDMLTRWRR
jgi:hypothetical protein